jgi:hypothetical protein
MVWAGCHALRLSLMPSGGCLVAQCNNSSIKKKDCTYADDLSIITSHIKDMAVQAHKVTAYSNWGNLIVNMDKSTATAALHQQQPYDPYDHVAIKKQLDNHLTIQGTPVKAHNPKSKFRYLGIYMTMDLNWKFQSQMVHDILKTKILNLSKSMLSRRQKTRILETCLRPMVTYTF